MKNSDYDVAVIGAGVVGCAIARELSRFDLRIGVFEKEPDAAFGTSCRNSGVLHSGINYKPGTKRAVFNIRGNMMMDKLCVELKVPIKRIGKLTVALSEEDLPGLYLQHEQGEANGVRGMELMDNEAMRKIQPGVSGILGLWTPSSAIISPYGLTIALAENARENGADFHLGSEITGLKKLNPRRETETDDIREAFELLAGGKKFRSRVVINAAGLYADKISGMLGLDVPPIWACRGEYYVLDKRLDGQIKTLIYPVPGPNDPGWGIHLTPTVDGNILIGPSADYIPGEERENYRVTASVLPVLRREGLRFLTDLRISDFIRNFAGNRPKLSPPEAGGFTDFIIEDTAKAPGFIHLLGIESPGLTSSPAIAEYVRDMVATHVELRRREKFIPERRGFAGRFHDLPEDERAEMTYENPEYGEIICRCEHITKKEVRDAIENILGARALTSLKYRARAMMGRCQGGFCVPRIVRLLRDEYGYRPEDYFMRGSGSYMFTGYVR